MSRPLYSGLKVSHTCTSRSDTLTDMTLRGVRALKMNRSLSLRRTFNSLCSASRWPQKWSITLAWPYTTASTSVWVVMNIKQWANSTLFWPKPGSQPAGSNFTRIRNLLITAYGFIITSNSFRHCGPSAEMLSINLRGISGWRIRMNCISNSNTEGSCRRRARYLWKKRRRK